MVFRIADGNFGLGLCALLAPVKVGCGKGQPVKIITDNSIKTLVFRNTDIPHPCIYTLVQKITYNFLQ
jgi:hypothetical protein